MNRAPFRPTRSRRRLSAMARGAAALLAVVSVQPAAADPRTTADGVYSPAQSAQGQSAHRQHCARCHDQDYYTGDFLRGWDNVPVISLFELIKLKMPEDRPGALEDREYAALLAYVFELNGLPAGNEVLSHDPEALAGILITAE